MPEIPRLPEAPESAVPPLLVAPPWTRRPLGQGPVVLKGLKQPKEPTAVSWPPGMREEWPRKPYAHNNFEPLPDGTDWEAAAETFRSGRALTDLEPRQRWALHIGVLVQAPPALGAELLADGRYLDDLAGYPAKQGVLGAVARHELAVYPMAMRVAKDKRSPDVDALGPFLDADVAQVMIKGLGDWRNEKAATAWFQWHGPAAVPYVVPDALRKPGPKRELAERALLLIAARHGPAALTEGARRYGDEAVRAMEAFRTDPLDQYPDPLPDRGAPFAPENLPRILLRGGELALPASATRHFTTMLLISTTTEPYPGVETVAEALDPASLAEFAWALYTAERDEPKWASHSVRYALERFGDDGTADRLAPIVAGWSKARVWETNGKTALHVFTAIGTDAALRRLHFLANKAKDPERIRRGAQARLGWIAEQRNLSTEQLADRLVPDLGLDADGGLTLDYGPRTFRVGFDEQLNPYVVGDDGKHRKTLPKPAAKDDAVLAPTAHKRFTELKKEARTVAADQVKRLERAMVTGRTWTPEEFRGTFLDHPLLRHVARRLVWTADDRPFRVAEDGTFADASDEAFAFPATARVALPHPLRLGDALNGWSEVFADYEILQPFPQLDRAVHTLTAEERAGTRLPHFEGAKVPNGPVHGLARQGWELGERESRGYRRQISLRLTGDRHVVIDLDPGIGTFDDGPVQELERITLREARYGAEAGPFGALDPVLASEVLATLVKLTGLDR